MSASLVAALAASDDVEPPEPAAAEVSALRSALEDQKRRLLVAVTQMAEFASAKAQEAVAMQGTVRHCAARGGRSLWLQARPC